MLAPSSDCNVEALKAPCGTVQVRALLYLRLFTSTIYFFSPPPHRPLALDIVSCSQREQAAHYMLSKCELHVQVVFCDISKSVMIELFDATVKP